MIHVDREDYTRFMKLIHIRFPEFDFPETENPQSGQFLFSVNALDFYITEDKTPKS